MVQATLPKVNARGMVDLNSEIPPEIDERIQRLVALRGGRYGLKKAIITLALEIGLAVLEQEQLGAHQ